MKTIETIYELNDDEIFLLKSIYLLKHDKNKVQMFKDFTADKVFKEEFFEALCFSAPKRALAIRFLTALGLAKSKRIQIENTKVSKAVLVFNYKKIEEIIIEIKK